jgi:hypothetical protein
MTTVLAFFVMLLVIAVMAVGVMFGRQPIAGSCGGLKALGIAGDCEICGGDLTRCESTDESLMAIDATQQSLRDR